MSLSKRFTVSAALSAIMIAAVPANADEVRSIDAHERVNSGYGFSAPSQEPLFSVRFGKTNPNQVGVEFIPQNQDLDRDTYRASFGGDGRSTQIVDQHADELFENWSSAQSSSHFAGVKPNNYAAAFPTSDRLAGGGYVTTVSLPNAVSEDSAIAWQVANTPSASAENNWYVNSIAYEAITIDQELETMDIASNDPSPSTDNLAP